MQGVQGVAQRRSAKQTTVEAPAVPSVRAVRVMVLDDEEHLARMFASALRDRGYSCDVFTDPLAALEKIKQSSYGLLISDIMMPQMSGIDLMKRVHGIKPGLKVIFITGLSNVETAVEVMKLGASDFIPKPFDLEAFCKRVDIVAQTIEFPAGDASSFQEPDTNFCPNLPGYQVVKRIGTGAMGSVFQARQVALNRLVAVKVIRSSLFTESDAFYRFMREARVAARMNHPNIIQVYDFVRHEGYLFLVMEYFPSRSLSSIVEKWGPLRWRMAVWITAQVARALNHAASQHIVHRDVKPSNILIGKGWHAKLTDFGLAKYTAVIEDAKDEAGSTRVGAVVGTPAFLSPEQAMSLSNIDVRSDLYNLGLCLYYMLEGRAPFTGNVAELIGAHIRRAMPHLTATGVPDKLDTIIQQMTEKDREKRLQTPSQVTAVLRTLVGQSSGPPSQDDLPSLGL